MHAVSFPHPDFVAWAGRTPTMASAVLGLALPNASEAEGRICPQECKLPPRPMVRDPTAHTRRAQDKMWLEFPSHETSGYAMEYHIPCRQIVRILSDQRDW